MLYNILFKLPTINAIDIYILSGLLNDNLYYVKYRQLIELCKVEQNLNIKLKFIYCDICFYFNVNSVYVNHLGFKYLTEHLDKLLYDNNTLVSNKITILYKSSVIFEPICYNPNGNLKEYAKEFKNSLYFSELRAKYLAKNFKK